MHRITSVARGLTLWRVLTVAAIIFAAGPSGAWLGEQFYGPIPGGWGWLGTVLIGLTVYGGVTLATRRERWGLLVILVGGAAAITFDRRYFDRGGHDPFTIWMLALFPTAIAVLAGMVEAQTRTVAVRVETARAEREAERREQAQREREEREYRHQLQEAELARQERIRLAEIDAQARLAEAEAERQHELKLAQLEARTRARLAEREARAALPDSVRSLSGQDGRDRTVPPDRSERLAQLRDMTEARPAQLADEWGVTERTARRDLAQAGFVRNGDGRWYRQGG